MARDSTIGISPSPLLAARRHAERAELQPDDGAARGPADANLDVPAAHRADDAHAEAEAVAIEEADEGARRRGPGRVDHSPRFEARDTGATEMRPEAAFPVGAAFVAPALARDGGRRDEMHARDALEQR